MAIRQAILRKRKEFQKAVAYYERILEKDSSLIDMKKNEMIILEEQLKDPDFAERFRKAGEAWEVALKLAAMRKEAGLSQKELARRVGTSQQQISRLESPHYEGHSLSMIRRVAEVLGATVRVEIEKDSQPRKHAVAESKANYKTSR